MSPSQNLSTPRDLPRQATVFRELCVRMRGPGGYYNAGNLLGLVTAIGLQFASAGGSRTGADIVVGYFVGTPQALAFTIATVIFLISGEVYHRAWKDGQGPDQRLNRLADLLSAAGGAALALSLLFLGQPFLAVVTGTLIVLGKLGSAAFGDDAVAPPVWPASWPDPFRLAVLAGRIPAISASALDLVHQVGIGSPVISLIQPAVLILCHVLWIKADLLLLDSGRKLVAAQATS